MKIIDNVHGVFLSTMLGNPERKVKQFNLEQFKHYYAKQWTYFFRIVYKKAKIRCLPN